MSSGIFGVSSAEDDDPDVEDEASGGLSKNIKSQDSSEGDPINHGGGDRALSHTYLPQLCPFNQHNPISFRLTILHLSLLTSILQMTQPTQGTK